MIIKSLTIKNFRSCRDISLTLQEMHALVGANNAGKSNILQALDFLFNPTVKTLNRESFWNSDIDSEIRVEAIYCSLNPHELEAFGPYLRPDKTFQMARTALAQAGILPEDLDISISQHYCIPVPKEEWLQDSKINGARIGEWWPEKDTLTIRGKSFGETLGNTKPTVGVWKEKAMVFRDQHLTTDDYEDTWIPDPIGYAGVLKSNLPHYILVPAVRDLSEEAKVQKTNPYGRLLYAILSSVTDEQRDELDETMGRVQERLNRSTTGGRLKSIEETELRLNQILWQYFDGDLEMEFRPPSIELLLTTPTLFHNDGFRSKTGNKGHGIQRAIIFSILQCYSELVTGTDKDKKRTMIFTVEEPELFMHPQAQRSIRNVFINIAQNGDQVLFATQSSLLLDVAHYDEIIRVEMIHSSHKGLNVIESRVWQLLVENMIKDFSNRHEGIEATSESIKELYQNAYHPNRAEGFFAKGVILVEGPTESYSLPIYADALDIPLDRLNVSIVECGGKGPMDRLYRLFNELGIACYMLFDYDKNSPDSNNLDKSAKLMELAGEDPSIPSELVVKDKVACFPRKWEEDLRDEVDGYCELEEEAKTAFGLRSDSGKPLISRYVARKLVSTDPPIIPPSIKGILQKSIQMEWSGSCLQLELEES